MNLTASSMNRMAFTTREPIGIVSAISAFNHPFNLIVHQVVPAVAVGCPVIVKPASTTPLSCLNLVDCLYEAGLPKKWAQVIICKGALAERMATDPRVSFLTFIGSGEVGWGLRSKLAEGTRCALEHGGAAPVIVEPDADIEDALPLLAKGGFYHAGQVCVSVQRIFVHEDIVENFSKKLVGIAKKLVVGDPTDEKTEVGPLIQKGEAERIHKWVEEAKAAGGKILTGGNKIGDTCYEPTVILNPPYDSNVSQCEIFGPVINIYSYKNRDDAIKLANDVPFSFQAAIFTKDINAALESAKDLNAAAVMVNDHTAFRVDWMPFAGRKSSGLGVGGILPTMIEMTEEKLIVFRSKSGGAHVFLFTKEWVTAAAMIEKLRSIAKELGLPKNVEIFPKQDRVREDGFGSFLNMPYVNAEHTQRYAYDDKGNAVDASDLKALYDKKALTSDEFTDLKVKKLSLIHI